MGQTQKTAPANVTVQLVESVAVASYERALHNQHWRESVRQNPKAVAWCAYMLFTCIMWGFDGLSGAVILGLTDFRKDYGTPYMGDYIVDARWQLAFTGGSSIGLIGGALFASLMAKRVGRQLTIFVAYLLTIGSVGLGAFTPGNLPALTASKILAAIPLGVFTSLAPPYISEVAPFALRGPILAGVNLAIVIGQTLSFGVLAGVNNIPGNWSYRTMLLVQWAFAAVALMGLPFFPESPLNLLSRGKEEKARKNIARLHGAGYDVDSRLAQIKATLQAEKEQAASSANIQQVLAKGNRLRTLVAVSTFVIQGFTGVGWVLGYMAYYLVLAGMAPQESFNATVGISCMMLVGNLVGASIVNKVGRRPQALYGVGALTVCLLLISVLSTVPNTAALYGQVVFMALWAFIYQATIGCVAWTITAEVPRATMLQATQSLAVMFSGLIGAIWSYVLPFMVNPDQGNLGGKSALVYFAFCFCSTIFIFFFYPETKGRTVIELDYLFSSGIPFRKFHKINIDPVVENEEGIKEVA